MEQIIGKDSMDKALEKINTGLTRIFDNVLHVEAVVVANEYHSKISLTEVHTIAAIGTGPLMSMGEVAAKLHITAGTLAVAINNLVRKGYVERFKSEKDRRIIRVGLTKQGKKVYHIHEKFHADMVEALTMGLSDKEMDIFSKVMSNLDSFLVQFYD